MVEVGCEFKHSSPEAVPFITSQRVLAIGIHPTLHNHRNIASSQEVLKIDLGKLVAIQWYSSFISHLYFSSHLVEYGDAGETWLPVVPKLTCLSSSHSGSLTQFYPYFCSYLPDSKFLAKEF